MSKKYNKLVRDKIPEIIKRKGLHPVTRTLNDKEFVETLIDMLCQEVDEFDQDRNVEELADILEVVMTLIGAMGVKQSELKAVRDKKIAANGGFKRRIFLEKVEDS